MFPRCAMMINIRACVLLAFKMTPLATRFREVREVMRNFSLPPLLRPSARGLWPVLNTGVCGLGLVLASGCVSNKALWQKHLKMGDEEPINMSSEWRKEGEKPPLVLTQVEITNA